MTGHDDLERTHHGRHEGGDARQGSSRLSAIRLLQAAIKQKEVDERVVADDMAVLAIVEKLIKQRKDSIEQFAKAGRTDLVDKEKAELDLLSATCRSRWRTPSWRPRSMPPSPSPAPPVRRAWAR